VAPWFAAAMTARAPEHVVAGVDVVVPVPADPGRRRRRGEDHAGLLAAGVASALGLPAAALLSRPRSTPAQHLLGRAARGRQPLPALAAPSPRRVLLVDDVHTTGATLRGAAEVLRGGGAERVAVLTALRTLR
jgi:predicted amidophosphoribosyltransferase